MPTAKSHVSHVGEGLQSLSQVPELHSISERSVVQSLNLHSNAIRAIENLQGLQNLTSLNLSSNNIRLVDNLSGLVNLTSLNLASNSISELRGLDGLSKLQQLNISYNLITSIQGITALHGSNGILARLNLQHNQLPSLQALAALAGCLHLQQLKVGGNPCTLVPAAYAALRQALPQVQQLDETEAVSLAASWQMAHAQLQAYDAGQQQQDQPAAHLQPATAHPTAAQHPRKHAGGRSPKRQVQEAEAEEECSISSDSSSSSSRTSSMEGVEALEAASPHRKQGQHGSQQLGRHTSTNKGNAGRAAALASPSKRAKADVSISSASVQTDDFISAAEVHLATEAQELRQQVSCLAGKT